jgi:nucleoside phosphorylase
MFFSASERLAKRTADYGALASELDKLLARLGVDPRLDAAEVAVRLGESDERTQRVLEAAATSEVGLLRAVVGRRCLSCGTFHSEEFLAERDDDETGQCTQCQESLEAADRVGLYELSETSKEEARQRAVKPARTALIVTALPLERDAVLAQLGASDSGQTSKGTAYWVGMLESPTAIWTVYVVGAGMGNLKAAVATERAISEWNPEIALFVGIAGGIKDVELGDVVASDEVYLYHSGKAADEFIARPSFGKSTFPTVQLALLVAQRKTWTQRVAGGSGGDEGSPKAVTAPIAAGEQVVTSTRSATYQLIRTHYDRAVAVEMEGSGFLDATYANLGLEALVIRGISDLLENKAEADAENWQPRAASHAAAFAIQLIHDRA